MSDDANLLCTASKSGTSGGEEHSCVDAVHGLQFTIIPQHLLDKLILLGLSSTPMCIC